MWIEYNVELGRLGDRNVHFLLKLLKSRSKTAYSDGFKETAAARTCELRGWVEHVRSDEARHLWHLLRQFTRREVAILEFRHQLVPPVPSKPRWRRYAAAQIRDKYKTKPLDKTYRQIAAEFGVSPQLVWQALNKRSSR